MRYKRTRIALICWCLFIGIGAVAGAIGMFSDLSGKALGFVELLPYFECLPFADTLFKDFLFPGIALLIVNGLTNLTAAILMIRKKKVGDTLGMVFGITLMLWICIQFVIFPANFMSTIYFFFGLAQAATGYACLVFRRQEQDIPDIKSYKRIGKNKAGGKLVVYFSRLGRTARAAYECADKLEADVYEIKATEPIKGTLGFWWCGRFGMHKWPMPIEPVSINLEKYKEVIICTPIWVFRIAGPVREFAKQASGHIKKVSYIAVHFNPWLPKAVFQELDALLGVKAEKKTSMTAALGRLKVR